MSDLDSLLSGVTGSAGRSGSGGIDVSQLGDLASAVQDEGGLDALIGQLRAGGLGDAVDSWVGTGTNQPIDPQQLGAALGPDEVQRLSAKSGLDIEALLPLLAAFLPQIINMLTPQGQVPAGGLNEAAQGQAPDLGGLLGGLMGAGSAGGEAGLEDLLGGLGGMLGGNKGQ
jgi:uncharacterized protein YidB (DUF937 family)